MNEPERIPGFQIVTRIGAGGMGEVFEAVRIGPGGFRKPVALKRLALDHALDRKAVERFLHEARISAHLEHPNIVRVHDLLEIDRRHFIVMELLRGANLHELGRLLREPGAVAWWIAFAAAEQVLAGLAYAHVARGDGGAPLGLVHRDLTPRNVFVCDNGVVKVLDFGIAKLRGALALGLTQDGRLPGTPEFMAPEQLRGEAVDVRSDLYQLGGTLFHALTGRVPHGTGGPDEVLQRVRAGDVEPIAAIRPDLPVAAASVIMRALAAAPADRFADADQMRGAVRELLRGLPDGAPALAALVASLQRDERARLSRETTRHSDDTRRDRASATQPLAGAAASASAGPASADAAGAASHPRPAPRTRTVAMPAAAAALLVIAGFAAARLIAPQARRPPPAYQSLTFRNGTVFSARFTPDGRSYVASAAWNAERTETFVGSPERPEVRSLDLPGSELLAVSRTGELALLYDVTLDYVWIRRGTLARAVLNGGAARRELEGVQWADYDAAGGLLVVRWVGDRVRIEYPPGHVLYEPAVGWIGQPRIAPGGDRVAFLRHPALRDTQGSVDVVDLDGHERTLSDGWSSVEGLAWSPSGEEIWFSGNRNGIALEVHAVTLDGRERLVGRAPGMLRICDVATDGRVLAVRDASQAAIVASSPGHREGRDVSLFDVSYVNDLSNDGTMLLFGEGGGEAVGNHYGAYLRKLDDASAVRLADGIPRALSPDGHDAIVVSPDRDRVFIVPTGAGARRELALGGPKRMSAASYFADGTRLLLGTVNEPGGARTYVADLTRNTVVPFAPAGLEQVDGDPISPDGKRVALFDLASRRIQLVNVADRTLAPLPGALTDERPIAWSEDGTIVYVAAGARVPLTVTAIHVDTGQRERWRELAPPDPTGVLEILQLVMAPSVEAYAYAYLRRLSTLYLVTGLE